MYTNRREEILEDELAALKKALAFYMTANLKHLDNETILKKQISELTCEKTKLLVETIKLQKQIHEIKQVLSQH